MENNKCCNKCIRYNDYGNWNCKNPNCKCHQQPQEVAELTPEEMELLIKQILNGRKRSQLCIDGERIVTWKLDYIISKEGDYIKQEEVKQPFIMGTAGEDIDIGDFLCVGDNGFIFKCRNKPQEVADWEKEFDKLLPEKEMFASVSRDYCFCSGSIKSFITKTLEQEIEKLIKEIEEWFYNTNPKFRSVSFAQFINKLKS
jgi:hypothetical protein